MTNQIQIVASKTKTNFSDCGKKLFKVSKIKLNGKTAELPLDGTRSFYVSENNEVFFSLKNGSIRPYAYNNGVQRMDLNGVKYRLINTKLKIKK